jgi:AcrR family transcriptional regulator
MVADALDVGKGTVYRYFPTKRSLFLGCVDFHMQQLIGAMKAAAGDARDPLARIHAAFRTFLSYFDRHRESVELFIQERAEFRDRNRPTYRRYFEAGNAPWKRFYQALMRKGLIRRMPVSRITDTTSSLLYGTIQTNLYTGRRKRFASLSNDLVDIIFHGILCTPARTRRKRGGGRGRRRRR